MIKNKKKCHFLRKKRSESNPQCSGNSYQQGLLVDTATWGPNVDLEIQFG